MLLSAGYSITSENETSYQVDDPDGAKIKITYKGKQHDGTSFKTCPFDIAKAESKDLGKTLIVAKVRYPNGKIVDTDEGVDTPIPSEEK